MAKPISLSDMHFNRGPLFQEPPPPPPDEGSTPPSPDGGSTPPMDAFDAKKVTKVKGFDADASYSVEGTDGGSFAIASSKKELKQLMKSDADVVYYEKKGKLYLNDNGTAKGWGAKKVGGLIAKFKSKPELSAEHFDGLSAHSEAVTGA